jgi:phosphatidate cytidylyltransferase
MKTRVITGLILVLAVFAMVAFVSPKYWLIPAAAVGVGVCVELCAMLKSRWPNVKILSLWITLLAALSTTTFVADLSVRPANIYLAIVALHLLLAMMLRAPLDKRLHFAIDGLFVVGYLTISIGSLMQLCLYTFEAPFWILLLLTITIMSDTGAYVAGRLMGRHKFAPSISPNKTWEGVAGAYVVAMGASLMLIVNGMPFFAKLEYWFPVMLIAITLSIAGDLFESLIKRVVGVKDSGTLIPGHGGVFDRVDSLLFVAPFLARIAEGLYR